MNGRLFGRNYLADFTVLKEEKVEISSKIECGSLCNAKDDETLYSCNSFYYDKNTKKCELGVTDQYDKNKNGAKEVSMVKNVVI